MSESQEKVEWREKFCWYHFTTQHSNEKCGLSSYECDDIYVCWCVCICGKVSSVRALPLRTLNIYLGFVCLWSAAAAARCAHTAPNWTECARSFCVAIYFIAICVMWTWYHNASAEDTKVNKLQFQIKIHREINVNEKKIENQEHVLLSHTIRILWRFNWKYTHFECDAVHEDIK